jgi:predicted ribosomally synthesized peptide with SipW-like signal peptide
MKKILLSLLTVGLVSGAVFGATRAYFSDTETSTGNVLGTGTFNVQLGGETNSGSRYANMDQKAFFNADGLMPGGDPATAYVEVKNDSTADMLFRLYADNFTVSKSGLAEYINVKVTLRPDELGSEYSKVLAGDLYGPSNAPIYEGTLADLAGVSNALDNIDAACSSGDWPLEENLVAVYKVEVSLDWSAPNKYQGQELTADLQLDATQFEKEICTWVSGTGWEYSAW